MTHQAPVPPLHIAIMKGGASNRQIAERFGLTIRYVDATRRALGVPVESKATTYDGRKIRSDMVRALIEAGHPAPHIAAALQVSVDYVRQMMRTAMTQSAAPEKVREQPAQCERHAHACRVAGGFWALSEVCLGLDPHGRRRMATRLLLNPPVWS